MLEVRFPDNFIWGASASSYQSEGAWDEDGKTENIWDRFCRTPGHIDNFDNGDTAADFYHRYAEDAKIMAELGLKVQRISISWARILPEGTGKVNQKGLDFYRRVVDSMLENGVNPFIMIYHWDMPQCLMDKGGWQNRDMACWLAELAQIVYKEFPEEVPLWGTILEPQIHSYHGWWDGKHAPGIKNFSTSLQVAHNILRAHGMMVDAFRASGSKGEIGITNYLPYHYPLTGSPEDVAAAKRWDGCWNRWFLDAIYKGKYPEDMQEWYLSKGIVLPKIYEGDMELISRPTDFFGLNYYYSYFIGDGDDRWPLCVNSVRPADRKYTAMGWPICPDGFYDILTRCWRDYGKKIIVTENGAAFDDVISEDGCVHDEKRIEYYKEHMAAMRRAIDDGADIRGYLTWSSFDNFEWALGYAKRFGLTYIDYETQKRTVKDSGKWYAQVSKNNAFTY